MAFYRIRPSKDGKRRYLYREERWRDPITKKVVPKSKCLGRVGAGRPGPCTMGEALGMVASSVLTSPLVVIPALPFMIGHELASGAGLERLREKWARDAAERERRDFYRHPPTVADVQAKATEIAVASPKAARDPAFDLFE